MRGAPFFRRPPVITAIAYGPDDHVRQEVADPADIPALLERWPERFRRIDSSGETEATWRQVEATLGDLFPAARR